MRLNSLLTLFTIVLTLSGCGGGGGGETPNQAPIANAGIDKTVLINQTVVITGSGTDIDGSIVSYQWKKGITVVGTTATFNYTPTATGTDILTLIVTDDDGAMGIDTMNVTVLEVDNTPPVFTSDTQYSTPENKRYTTSDILAQDISDISYAITGGEDSSKFAIDSYDATLMFREFPDYDTAGDTDEDNIYQATITATDTQNNNASQDITVELTNVDENIPKSYQVVSNLPDGVTTLALGNTPKDVYLLFTNTDPVDSHTATVLHDKFASIQSQKVYTPLSEISSVPKVLHAPDYIQEFNSNSRNYLTKTDTNLQFKVLEVPDKNQDIVGEEKSFCVDIDSNDNCIQWTPATSKKVISNITSHGIKTLNIWVSNNSFGVGCLKSKCVTQNMIDELANNFLRSGANNDIYDWVTNIYGEEWETDTNGYTNLIPANDEITILLTDIYEDNRDDGGVVGFFWAKDNYKISSVPGSNERVMFYIDSVMFANGDNTWDIDDFWPKELISTLAHEFQHMIDFYQKNVLLNANADTWIKEMLSESTEDLVATKIKHIGPRGVDYLDGSAGLPNNPYGRYPLFNQYNTLSLTAWNNQLEDYSKVNAFGAYLIRNYGGETILHDIMHNNSSDAHAVVDAVNNTTQGSVKTIDDLIHEWGISVLLSDHIDALRNQYSYNTNDFTVSLKDPTIYKMGSINFFNYFPKPSIETSMNAIAPQGNYYYEVVTNQTGDFNVTITKDANVVVSAVIKE